MKNNIYGVVLAGGSGTRFWPLSRELYPKQLLRLVGRETMLQRTLLCAKKIAPVNQVCVVTQRNQADAVRMQASAVSPILPENLIAEPQARNTAAAIGLAAITLMERDPEAVMVVMPADHVILRKDRFARAVRAAGRLARKHWLVTLGIKPNQPETGYGYIQRGKSVQKGLQGYRVSRFTEKPKLQTARRYIRDGRYYWNSGIFIWKAADILSAIREHQPKIYKGLAAIKGSLGSSKERKTVEKIYSRMESVSIDYGVLERVRKNLAVVPVDMGWSDVGSWSAMDQVNPTDSRGNVIVGNVVDLESRNSILYADKRLVATIGLQDLVVVDTEDATLVCDKSRVQDVRKVVDVLKRRGAEERLVHRTVWRPWGTYTVLEEGKDYKIKRIMVNPGARLSLQLHHHRSEHWVVVSGIARVTCGKRVYDLQANQSTYIPLKTKHRLENPGRKPLQIIEVQSGGYVGEDDIVRFQDDYGRGAE